MATRRPRPPVIKNWILLGKALDLVKAIPGSRVEREICEHMRTEQLPAKYWRQRVIELPLNIAAGQWEYVNPEYWTLENLRKVRSVDGVDQAGRRNWYHVKLSRFLELYPTAAKVVDAPPEPGEPPPVPSLLLPSGRIDWKAVWKYDTGRRARSELPPEEDYTKDIRRKLHDQGIKIMPDPGDLRRHKRDLYANKAERTKRKRPPQQVKQPKSK
jgi:hypothetical protein